MEEWKRQKEAMMKSDKAREKMEPEKQRVAEESIMAEKRKTPKATEAGGRRKKKRKLEPLTEWGEHPLEV